MVLVAEGGMSEVYKVRHLHLDEIRMVKIMRPGSVPEDTHQLRFQHEAKLARMVRHPNVATLHDFSRLDDGSFYMVWEHLDGQTVQNWTALNRQMTPLEAIDVALQVLDGLQAIHDAGIVHRDISPDNIMVVPEKSRDGQSERLTAKIIDLGIAKRLDLESSAARRTETGTFIGKAKYASPEQAGLLRKGEAIDARSDIYSLGVTLYEMLSGTVPFESSTLEGYLLKHLREVPPPLRKAVPTIPRSLEEVVSRAMEKERDHRFASATAFREALAAARADVVSSSETKKTSRFKLPTLSIPHPNRPQDMTTERTGVSMKVEEAGTLAASLTPKPEGERSAERAIENMLPGELRPRAKRLPIILLVGVLIPTAVALTLWKRSSKPVPVATGSGQSGKASRGNSRPAETSQVVETVLPPAEPVTEASDAGLPANVEGGIIPTATTQPIIAPAPPAAAPSRSGAPLVPSAALPPRNLPPSPLADKITPPASQPVPKPPAVSETSAMQILRSWITTRNVYPADSACFQVRSLGLKNAGYTAEAIAGDCNAERAAGSVIGKWRVDAITGDVYVQNARGRYVSP